jgi:predicted GH43/DUF377 family glycosyl hydrolase
MDINKFQIRKTINFLIFYILLLTVSLPSFVLAQNEFHVTKHPSPVLSPLPSSLWDTHEVEPSSVIKDGDTYKMWYTAYDGKTYRIGYMSSKDGIDWERLENPVLDVSSKEFWDNFGVAYPFVMKEGAVYKMWYTGSNGKRMAIGDAAGTGARMVLLSMKAREDAELIAEKVEHIQIANEKDFNNIFIESMLFKG